jgi:hypothetical protein
MELILKTSWAGVTIKDYMNYKCILEDRNTTDFEKQLDILALLLSVDRKEMMSWPANQVTPLFDKMKFLTVKPYSKVEPYYDINGRKFELIMDVNKLTAGQFIDLSHYTKDQELVIDNLHLICSTLLLPIGKYKGKHNPKPDKYDSEKIGDISEFLYEHMPISEALGISNFFTFLFDLFTEITKLYLEAERTKQLSRASKMLKQSTMTLVQQATGSRKSGIGSLR